MNNDELNFAINSGIIDLSYIQEQLEMKKRNEFLNCHPYKIYEGKDGYFYTYLPKDDNQRRPFIKRKTLKEVQNIVVEYWRDKEENPTLEEIFNSWNDKRFELGKISKTTHQRNSQIFNRHFSNFGQNKIKNLDPIDVEDFLEKEIFDKNLTSKAFSNLKSITKGFLKRAKKMKYISWSVTEMFDDLDVSDRAFKKNKKNDEQEVFSDEEIDRLFAEIDNNPDAINLGIMLMFFTGLRVGELAALQWSDYDGTSLSINKTEIRYAVGNKLVFEIKETPKTEAGIRKVVLPKDAIKIMARLRSINPFGEYIFMREDERLKTYSFRNRLRWLCKKIDCVQKSPHKIRKTYATILLDNGVDTKLVESQMGHTDIMTTETHYHRDRRNIVNKQRILNNIPEFAVGIN